MQYNIGFLTKDAKPTPYRYVKCKMGRVSTGIDLLEQEYWKGLKGQRLGLLANQASVDGNLRQTKQIISDRFPGQLKSLYGPQHGFGGQDQDNMVETPHAYDTDLQIPIFSLYAESRAPHPHMLEMIDILIIDLQDVGTRVYTFAATMLNCLRAAASQRIKVLVLDRPNPLGGQVVEGNLLQPDLFSFVGPYTLPMRHGLTMGEMANVFRDVFRLECDIEIIPMRGWDRKMLWEETGLRWIMPSPNMPLPQTAQVYPGQVIWEGTNVSEGRGTCRPFEIFGAPYFETKGIQDALETEDMAGCVLQPYSFRPTFHKWAEEICHGFMIHILDPDLYRPYTTSLAILKTIMKVHRNELRWKAPPYEYEYDRRPIDLILGDPSLCNELESDPAISSLEEKWSGELKAYIQWREPYLLYR